MNLVEILNETSYSFTQLLENKARSIVMNVTRADNPPERTIERSIAFILWQIGEQRKIKAKFFAELRNEEFYIYRDLEQAKIETKYRDFNSRIDRLKDKLGLIDREWRAIEMRNHEEITRLLERLLVLVNQHSQVIITYEDGR